MDPHHHRLLFVAVVPVRMRPCQFFGTRLGRVLSSVPVRLSSSSSAPAPARQAPVALTPRKPKPPEKRKTRGRKKDLKQWQKFIDRDLNAEQRGLGFWPSGSVARTTRERHTRNVFTEKYNRRIMEDFKDGGFINTVLSGGPLDDLLYTLRARYLERVYAEEIDEVATPLNEDIEALYAASIREIRACDEAYYGDDPKPLVEDKVYDELVMHVLELERLYPEILSPDSPSQVVGHSAARRNTALYDAMEEERETIRAQEMLQREQRPGTSRNFQQMQHPVPMLSLGNAYSIVDLASFSKKVEHSKARICAELKIDGVALSLHYENRTLVAAVTRGNGRMGDDVIDNIRAGLIGRGVLETLPDTAPDSLVIVRGEVFIPPAEFAKLQDSLQVKLTNARNAAAGAIKHKDAAEVRQRGVHFVAYECLAPRDGAENDITTYWPSQGQALAELKRWGFGPMPKYAVVDTIEEAETFAAEIERTRSSLPFEADGVVLKVDDAEKRIALGSTAKAPRGAIALKFTARSVITTLNVVKMQVSRNGVITPVAELAPVEVGGATIRRATLHNFDEISRLGIAVGDEVVLERGGDVIPKIVQVHKFGSHRIPVSIPKSCPCCDGEVKVEKNEAGNTTVKCTEPASCAGQNLGRLLHFVSRNAMDVRGVGEKTAKKLLESGLVVRLGDLFKLTIEELQSLDGIQEKTATSLYQAIQDARNNRTLERLIISLGVPGIGRASARALALRAINLKGFQDITSTGDSMLLGTPNIAEKTAERIGKYLSSQRMQAELKEIAKNVTFIGVVDDPDDDDDGGDGEDVAVGNIQISGKRFAFTGKLHSVHRGKASHKINESGGKVGDLTRKTDYLICGVDPGEKLYRAQRLGIRVISEDEIAELLSDEKPKVKYVDEPVDDGELVEGIDLAPATPVADAELVKTAPELDDDDEYNDNDPLAQITESFELGSEVVGQKNEKHGPYYDPEEQADVYRMPLAQALYIDARNPGATYLEAMEKFNKVDREASQEASSEVARSMKSLDGINLEKEEQDTLNEILKDKPDDPVFKEMFEDILGTNLLDNDTTGTKGPFLPSEEELDKYLEEIFSDPKNVQHAIELSQKYPVKGKGKGASSAEVDDDFWEDG